MAFEPAQFLVSGAEVMSPFTDAVSFIDSNAVQLLLFVNYLKIPTEAISLAKFRRDIKKSSAWVAGEHIVEDETSFGQRCVRVYSRDSYANCSESIDLVHLFWYQLKSWNI
jgi:hypothetical protein